MTSATTTPTNARVLPPVLGRLASGTFWLALRTPLQAVFTFWTVRLTLESLGAAKMGAYSLAWSFGFLQFLLEFGIGSALQRQVSDRYTRGDRLGVNRAIACGMNFYAVVALIQVAALMTLAYVVMPRSEYSGESYSLIIKVLWLQALTAPCYGISMVVSSVLQAARRYEFIPRLEVGVVIIRFLLLWGGVRLGVDFFNILVAQTAAQVGLVLVPAIWVMSRELGYAPHFSGARWADFKPLLHISFYMFLMQLSVVLADRIDASILGFALPAEAGEMANTIYAIISKPFVQIRMTGWMLASMVMPAVASLAAASDEEGLDRMKYDAPRLHLGLLLPVGILAWIYAAPFLSLWVGDRLVNAAGLAPQMRLFLLATIPLIIGIQVQMAIGMNKVSVIAISTLCGALINLPISYALTIQLGDVRGVIWGTVLTTIVSNLLVPGAYIWRVLKINPATYCSRTLSAPLAGAAALLAVSLLCRYLVPIELGTSAFQRAVPLVAHLSMGCVAYLLGYFCVAAGRSDLDTMIRLVRSRIGG
ncbi:lipopolysaccharide biosynthesis protein [Singulisphaera sp. PoT]|uniref:lipopolysaccharide biosynthesis protein n=1 Tax=Singulisphaera sp. PoT TaxID=3411797 RepID=UPI003BF5B5FD